MKPSFSEQRPPRRSVVIFLLGAAVVGTWLTAPQVHSQAPAANPAVDALLVKLKTQEDTMVANQTKIEAQTALLKENLRQSKIFTARSGSGHR